ncbi:MAG: hypothetical protein AAB922_05810, partial [Patescibacteria group bacterium]
TNQAYQAIMKATEDYFSSCEIFLEFSSSYAGEEYHGCGNYKLKKLTQLQIIPRKGDFIYLSDLDGIERSDKSAKVVKVLFLIALFLNFYYFYHGYMTHYAREYSSEWQYPYREAVSYIQDEKHKFDKIVITEALGRPYIYFLTYGKFDPKEFRKEAKIEREVFGFVHVRSFDKYKFENDINLNKLSANTLYLDVPRNLTINAKIVKTFYLMDGKPAFIAYETYK